MRESPASVCPVPTEQQPLNEYEQLKKSWLFRWATIEGLKYLRKLVWFWVWGWIVAGPIAARSFEPAKEPVLFALCGSAGAGVFVVLLVLRLYLGWSYVRDRLTRENISYEESGWYDGQIWQKPPEVLRRDRLVVSYQIQPILARLRRTFAILALLVSTGTLIWLVFVNH